MSDVVFIVRADRIELFEDIHDDSTHKQPDKGDDNEDDEHRQRTNFNSAHVTNTPRELENIKSKQMRVRSSAGFTRGGGYLK